MTHFRQLLGKIPLHILALVCVTLGLAPFTPEPHVWEKLQMLFSGTLVNPIDIFDLVLHGTPWLLMALRLTIGIEEKA